MIFVLTMLFTFVYDRKNENHWSLLIIRYSLLITRNTNTQETTICAANVISSVGTTSRPVSRLWYIFIFQ